MKEKWVQINKIQGFENVRDCYWISNTDEDKIVNRNTGKKLKPWIDHYGYPTVKLRTNQGKYRTCKIHTLKAKAFIYTPNPLTYDIVRHLNDIKTDNRLENLAWGNQSNNTRDCIRNGNFNYEAAIGSLTEGIKKRSKPVRCIETGVIYASTREVERKFGIDNNNISRCCCGKNKTSKGFHWEYINKEEVNNDDMEREQIR